MSFIDITNRDAVNELLHHLKEDADPAWGKMRAQHMVEHLAVTLQFSNGKMALAQRGSDEESALAKQFFIYTDVEMKKGIKTSLLGDEPAPFTFPSLEAAVANLNRELDDFMAYYAGPEEVTAVHPRMGPLNGKEWIVFHNKHFTHHFKQFGLL